MKINSVDLCDMLFGAFIGVSLTAAIVSHIISIHDMGVRLRVPRSLIITADVGERLDAPPRRVPDPPARDFTFWEALVLVAVGVIVLLLLARATG